MSIRKLQSYTEGYQSTRLITKYQHYYPSFSLANFSDTKNGRSSKLMCLRAHSEIPFSTVADKIGGERNLYEPLSSYRNEIENLLSVMDGAIHELFKKLTTSVEQYVLTGHENKMLTNYVNTIELRNPSVINNPEAMVRKMEEYGFSNHVHENLYQNYGRFLKQEIQKSSRHYQFSLCFTVNEIPLNLTSPIFYGPGIVEGQKVIEYGMLPFGKNIFLMFKEHTDSNSIIRFYFEDVSCESSLVNYVLSKQNPQSTYIFSHNKVDMYTSAILGLRDMEKKVEPQHLVLEKSLFRINTNM